MSSQPGLRNAEAARRRARLFVGQVGGHLGEHVQAVVGGTITVTVRAAGDRVHVEVTDDGGPTAPRMRRDDDLAEAGRGLRLVEAYSLIWDYHRDGTRLVTWFECVAEPLP